MLSDRFWATISPQTRGRKGSTCATAAAHLQSPAGRRHRTRSPVSPGNILSEQGPRRYTGRMHALIESHREQLLPLARRRGITSVRVFGSMARNEARDDSDVDLLVTLMPGTSALALGGLLLDAQELLGRHVDVVTEASLHPALRDRVLADAVAL